MRKKEFKMLVATNPVLYQWLKENSLLIKSRPEIMTYLTQHPEAMRHFRSGQAIDNERIFQNSQLFMKEWVKERKERKGKGKGEEMAKVHKERGEKGGLLSNLKSMFSKPPAVIPTSSQLPAIHHPGMRAVNQVPVGGHRPAQMAPKQVQAKKLPTPSAFKIPKIKVNRKKLMSTLNQTTEMLDVVGALIGKVSNLK